MFKKGSHIVTFHRKSSSFINYLVVQDKTDSFYKLLNLNSNNIMSDFKTEDFKDIEKYLTKVLKLDIVGVK